MLTEEGICGLHVLPEDRVQLGDLGFDGPLIDTEGPLPSLVVKLLEPLPQGLPLRFSTPQECRGGVGHDARKNGFLDIRELRADLLQLLLQASSFIVRLISKLAQVAVDAIDEIADGRGMEYSLANSREQGTFDGVDLHSETVGADQRPVLSE